MCISFVSMLHDKMYYLLLLVLVIGYFSENLFRIKLVYEVFGLFCFFMMSN